MGSQPITVFWKNIRGETIYVEDLTLNDALALIEQDDRASYNRYVLPDATEVDDFQLREWYVSKMQASQSKAA